jgi:hypothetical protein
MLNRRKTVIASNFVSMQEIDERTADLSNKKAAVNSGHANVERLEALAGYKKITAPFDGVVAARNTDVGTLISGGAGSGPAMFVVSDIRDQNGLRLATVGAGDKVLFKTVTIARDLGRDIELASGISLDDRIVIASALLASIKTAPPRQAPKCGNEISFWARRRLNEAFEATRGPRGDNSPGCRSRHLSRTGGDWRCLIIATSSRKLERSVRDDERLS